MKINPINFVAICFIAISINSPAKVFAQNTSNSTTEEKVEKLSKEGIEKNEEKKALIAELEAKIDQKEKELKELKSQVKSLRSNVIGNKKTNMRSNVMKHKRELRDARMKLRKEEMENSQQTDTQEEQSAE